MPYRDAAIDVPVPRRSSRLARVGIVLGTACVVASASVWLGCIAAITSDVHGATVPLLFALAVALLALAAFVDHRVRHMLAARPDLSGRWPIECARRRRELAFDLLATLLTWAGLALGLVVALFVILP